MYWRCVAKHFHNLSSLDALERILPELSSFTVYIKEFLTMMSSERYGILETKAHQFILLQLFEIIKIYDLSDEAGRNNLSELILNVLLTDHCSKEIIECIVNHLENVIPDVNKRLDLLSNTIGKIRTPTKVVTTQVIKKICPNQEHKNNMEVSSYIYLLHLIY